MAVQDAELQLKVSLDLAFFRQQLSGLGQAAAGYNVPINVKFDRRSVQNELNALGRNISQRTYRLEVATNISQEIKNAGTLAKALRGLDSAIQKNRGIANRAATGVSGGTVDAGKIQTLVNKATKPALQALYSEMSKASIPMAAVGKDTVANLRNAILSGVPQLTTDLARGISNGLNPQMKESGSKGAKLFIDAWKDAAGIASPSKVFKALGEFSAEGLEIGFLNGLKDFKTKAIGEIKQIVALMKLELASVGDVRIGPGTGAARAGARGGRQYMNPIGPLPTGSREPWAFSQYRYQPFMAQPGQVRGAGVPPMRTRQPFLSVPPVMGTTSSPGMLGQARLALPAAGETSARAMREAALALREFTARQRSDARSASVMGENRMWSRVAGQVPVGAGGPFLPPGEGGGVPPRPPLGGGGGVGGMGGFGRALSGVNLPGTGVVREIGNEFAMATKQVLLFGTAYKALAFITSFPAQVGQAVGALQSFNNTLKAISPTAEEAKASNQFILDIVDRYNVPLQSARDGFTKLYASMAPAGFKGDEIRDLFTSVSQAAATFGMSADKVDRVNYAFAQMASKGQVMSEELKGQLGDVLPGAMGIFAEAAGFQGPDAIQKFSKALEDGAYKGEAMRQLLNNVTIVMTKEFGPGAEGAARTFQGVINRMQNSTKLLYEAFEPVAVGFLNSVVVPLTNGIKTVSDGFNAFFTGTQAQTAGGMAFVQELEKLRPTFEGIQSNIKALIPSFQIFGSVLLNVVKLLATVAGNPITGFLLRVYANILLVNTAFTLLGGRILVGLITSINGSIARIIAMNVAMASLQRTTAVANSSLAGTQLQMLLLQRSAAAATGPVNTLLSSLVRMAALGAIAIVITVAINGLAALQETEARIARLRGEKNPVGPAGPIPIATASRRYAGATREKVTADQQKQIDYVAKLRQELNALEATQTRAGDALGQTAVGSLSNIFGGFRSENTKAKITELKLLIQNAEDVINLDPGKFKTEAQRNQAQIKLAAVTTASADKKGSADRAAQDAARLASQQQQNAIDAANRQNSLNKAIFEGAIALSDQEYQHRIDLIDARNQHELAGLNSIEARQEKFQQDLQRIELQRIDTVRKAQQEAAKASIEFTAAQNTAMAAQMSGVGAGGEGKAVFGATGRTFNAPGWVHGHFQNMNREALVKDTVEVVMGLLQQGVTPELSSGAPFKKGMNQSQIEALVRQGIASHKKYASGTGAIDVFVPKGTNVPVPLSGVGNLGGAAGVTGTLPRGSQLMHLDPSSASGAVMQRREAKAGGKLDVEQQQLFSQQEQAKQAIIFATNKALEDRSAIIRTNINAIFPVAEQRLENDLMTIRNRLQLEGMPQEYIDYQESVYKGAYEAAESIKKLSEETIELTEARLALEAKQAKGLSLTQQESESLRYYTESIKQNDAAITDLVEKQKQYQAAQLEGALATLKNADALEMQRQTLGLINSSVESASNSYKGFFKEVAMGGDSVEALKKLQEAMADQALTLFFDFAMKPVENFYKEQLSAFFGVKTEEQSRQEAIAKMEQQLAVTQGIAADVATIAGKPAPGQTASPTAATINSAAVNDYLLPPGATVAAMTEMGINGANSALPFDPIAIQQTDTALAGFNDQLKNVNLSSYGATEAATNLNKNFQTQGNVWQQSLGKAVSALGIAAGSVMGIAAGIGQIKEGGTSNILGGVGSLLMSAGGFLGGFGSLFGFANGGVARGGIGPIKPFANGGTVSGPTLGLIGEGKYNEAIVPLPDGRSIPVQMRGNQQSSRDLLADQRQQQMMMPNLSMSFQTSTINGVEYVSRDQLEAAMAATRRQAARDGAQRGMDMTLDKIQNSPSTRSRIGVR